MRDTCQAVRVRDAEVEDLSGAHQIVQAAQDFVDRCRAVPDVQVQQVDVVGPELREAPLHGADHALAMVAAGVGVARGGGHRVLGRDHEAVTLAARKLPQQPLGAAVGVLVRCVNEVAAAVDIGVEEATRLVGIRAPTPVLSEGHGAERQRRNAQTGAAEKLECVEGSSLGHGFDSW
jgi:hypothetical protein